jgi:hypothetical protein
MYKLLFRQNLITGARANWYLYQMEKFLENLFIRQQYNPNNFFLIAGPFVVESEEPSINKLSFAPARLKIITMGTRHQFTSFR